MNHVSAIGQLIKSISKSETNHAVLIEGPPGFGKTTAVDQALQAKSIKAVHLGAYSTPLNLYNFLFENADKFVVIDDTSLCRIRHNEVYTERRIMPKAPLVDKQRLRNCSEFSFLHSA